MGGLEIIFPVFPVVAGSNIYQVIESLNRKDYALAMAHGVVAGVYLIGAVVSLCSIAKQKTKEIERLRVHNPSDLESSSLNG